MATFALIHGGGGSAWDWHLVARELREDGHDPTAVDLPCEDESAGWWDYADAVVGAMGDRSEVVVVGHSLGGFTAPLVCARLPVDLLVLVAAMIPSPGELFDDGLRPLLELPVELVLPAHGAPTDRAALERALF